MPGKSTEENPFNKDTFLVLLIASGAEKQFKRLNKTKDPVVRYTLFLEFLRTIIESGLSIGEMSLEEEIYNQETEVAKTQESDDSPKDQLLKARNLERLHKTQRTLEDLKHELEKYFDGFSDWIAQPVYSPDHPIGHKMMRDAEKDLGEKISKKEEQIPYKE